MNERIRQLADEAGLRFTQLMSNPMVPVVDGKETDLEKFAELIVRECIQLNRKQSYELAGVIVDTELGHGFDDICLNTIKRVEQYLLGNTIKEHFGVE